MTLDTSQRREGYASRSRPASDEIESIRVAPRDRDGGASGRSLSRRRGARALLLRLGLLH